MENQPPALHHPKKVCNFQLCWGNKIGHIGYNTLVKHPGQILFSLKEWLHYQILSYHLNYRYKCLNTGPHTAI